MTSRDSSSPGLVSIHALGWSSRSGTNYSRLLARHHRTRARFGRIFAPKGPKHNSPGQRPGTRSPTPSPALKGRHKPGLRAPPCTALSGLFLGGFLGSRGVAPGWFVWPLRGKSWWRPARSLDYSDLHPTPSIAERVAQRPPCTGSSDGHEFSSSPAGQERSPPELLDDRGLAQVARLPTNTGW